MDGLAALPHLATAAPRATSSMRIAILDCSPDGSDHAEHYPNDGEKYVALLGPLRPDWTFHTVTVHENVLPGLVSDHDAYVISGSSRSNCEDGGWVDRLHGFIRKLDEARSPTVGICFGHQAIALALGGAVADLPGSDQGEQTHVGMATMKMCAREPWMKPWRESVDLRCLHEEQVVRLPERARLLAWHHECPVAMFAVGDEGGGHMLGCEFHPEVHADYLVSKIRSQKDVLGEEKVARAEDEAKGDADGGVVGEWMVRFIEQARAASKP